MQPLFPLGEVKIMASAAALMARAGQDADFFLQMHVCGVWSDEHAERNKQSLQTGSMIENRYRTLLGDEITVVTLPDRRQTAVLALSDRRQTAVFADSHEPSFHHYGYTYDPGPDCGYTLSGPGSTTAASPVEASLSTFGVFDTTAASPPADQNEAAANDQADSLPLSNVPAFSPVDTDSLAIPFDKDELNLEESDYTMADDSLSYHYGHGSMFASPFELLG